ncbi:MAG: hypothetical protein V1838_01365 [Patescibacteria group bacterium]
MKLGLNFKMNRKVVNFYTKFSRFVAIGVIILLGLIGYLLLLSPKWEEVSSVGLNDYAQEQDRLEEDKMYLTELKKLVANYNNISQRITSDLEIVLPSQYDLPALFVQMEALAKAAGASLTSVNFAPGSEADINGGNAQLKVVNIGLSLGGGSRYSDAKNLLDAIEHNKPLLDVVSITFSLEETETVSLVENTGSYSVNVRTYYIDTSAPSSVNTSIDQQIQDLLDKSQQ